MAVAKTTPCEPNMEDIVFFFKVWNSRIRILKKKVRNPVEKK